MVVICEECGKIYHLDPEKLKANMKGNVSKIKCRVCDHVITITKPDDAEPDTHNENMQEISLELSAEEQIEDEVATVAEDNNEPDQNLDTDEQLDIKPSNMEAPKHKKKKKSGKGSTGFGLRTKMFLLFLLIPILLIISGGVFSQIQMNQLAKEITKSGTDSVLALAEDSIVNKAISVASQCQIYLKSNPGLNKDDFQYDYDLKTISVQKKGAGRYTALIELPEEGESIDKIIAWTHPDYEFIGKPYFSMVKEHLASDLGAYKKIFSDAFKNYSGATGRFKWKEKTKNGKVIIKEKFIAIEPVEQTPYMIISTTNISEFTQPISKVKREAEKRTAKTRNINLSILIVLIFVIGAFIVTFGYKLTNDIHKLTDAADRISVGELDVVIDISSKDEIGNLAEAITRMQDSLRFSIERLRRKR